jgi:hypothetical protein
VHDLVDAARRHGDRLSEPVLGDAQSVNSMPAGLQYLPLAGGYRGPLIAQWAPLPMND